MNGENQEFSRKQSWLLIAACLVGLALSILTVVEHVGLAAGEQGFWFCQLGSVVNCASVLQSEYGEIFGIPLGSYGIVFYVALIFLALFARRGVLAVGAVSTESLFFLSTLAALSSAVLFAISLLLIKGLCPLCLGTYAVNFFLFGVLAAHHRRQLIASFFIGLEDLVTSVARLFFLREAASKLWLSLWFGVVGLSFVGLFAVWLPHGLAQRGAQQGAGGAQPQFSVDEWFEKWKASPIDPLPKLEEGSLNGDFGIGPIDAPVQILEFSDFECPFCQVIAETLEGLTKAYPQHVRLTFKNFPPDKSCNFLLQHEMHKYACLAAEAARCAGEQGMFAEFISHIFLHAFREKVEGREQLIATLMTQAEALGM